MVFERETKEFLPVVIRRDGNPVSDNIELCIATAGERPATWTPAQTTGIEIGTTIQNLTPGSYTLWARITTAAETPVLRVTNFDIT